MKNIIIYGSLNMDMSIRTEDLPKKGETIEGDSFFLTPGGKGANQAVAASKSGAKVYMIGSVGEDVFGDQLINTLQSFDVNCKFITKSNTLSSGVAMIIRSGKDNRIIINSGANHALTSADVSTALDQIAVKDDIFLSQFETGHKNVMHSIVEAKKRNMFTVLNPAPAKYIEDNAYQSIDLLIVNQSESEFLTGIYPTTEPESKEVIAYFLNKGVSSVIITLGSAGSIYGDQKESMAVSGFKAEVVDTTAAGDTYIGALLYSLSKGEKMDKSMLYASKAAALTVTKNGAQEAIPFKNEIEHFKEEE
ncbi:Ribokinase [Paraliobacillus sp. PM-2]|uniref:ribokinase n=1 Tax=Paraliobacillus sp. PM-2 TaxID=1462524 RepID=UPI00061C8FF6|nr:ribokinase [Paraliobacillus sp. PM-2]CQR48150.1 Ribokinase [Paraliobacillus sp. PM-2]